MILFGTPTPLGLVEVALFPSRTVGALCLRVREHAASHPQ